MKARQVLSVAAAIVFGGTLSAMADQQAAIDGCIDQLRTVGGPDAAGGEVVNTEWAEAGNLITLQDAGGTIWECVAYDDGSVGDLRVVEAADDGGGAMAEADDGGGAMAGSEAEATRVQFESGNDNASVEGQITGNGYHDYLLGAQAGQKMSVSLITKGTCYFNILPPGSDNAAIYNGSMDGLDAINVDLPADGDYTIRVYLMGNDRDSGATVGYQLSMTIM